MLEATEDLILIEDYPGFKNYNNILLVDRPYNLGVKGVMRIFGTRHMNNVLEYIKSQK